MQNRTKIVTTLENISLAVLGIFFFIFPLLFLSTTTDAFVLPKQIGLTIAVALLGILLGIKTIVEGKLRLRTSPFNTAVAVFIFVAFLSALFSVNRFDALTAFVPLLFTGFLYFAFINLVKGQKQLLFVLSALILGAVISAVLSLFSFFQIYLLPFQYTHVQAFSTFGSLLDQAIYLALILPMTAYFAYFFLNNMKAKRGHNSPFAAEASEKDSTTGRTVFFSVSFLIVIVALGVTVFQLMTTQKPLILPFSIGLQTGFAAISQATENILKNFFLGSGIGTYLVDFTRFKPAFYNLNETLWSFSFFRSSSYVLELLATTGVLGTGAFLFLVYKIVKEDRSFFPILLAIAAAFLLPFSFTLVTLFFILLAIFAVIRTQSNPDKYGDIHMYLVAFKKGFFVAVPEGDKAQQNNGEKRHSKVLPATFFLFMLVVIGVPLYFSTKFFLSDFIFQQSLVAASQNKALDTYNLQTSAIQMFPYRDAYYRSFSQTNLAIANSLVQRVAKEEKANAQTQQQIVVLIQQSISAARGATTIAPLNTFNWNNLSSVYRSLIGFGQNADQFAITTMQQAIALDPNNPQQYVNLGGIYYQLGQYDESIRQFQIAINLKNNYANAYYNLGHALEEKGDLQNALAAYQAVKSLVASNPENTKKIDADIATLQEKIGQQSNKQQQNNGQTSANPNEPLNVNQAATQLPERDPQVKIPAPTVSAAPTGKTQTNTKQVSPTTASRR